MINSTILNLLGQSKQLTLGPLIHGAGIPVPCYPDLRGLLSQPKNLMAVAEECAALIKKWNDTDCIAGCAMGGVALATAIAIITNKPLLLLRKTPRSYGLQSAIDGRYKKGQRVLLIDDSIVTGVSKHSFIEQLLKVKLRPVRFFTIMDVGGAPVWQHERQWFQKKNIELHSLVTWTAWALYMRDRGRIPRRTVDAILRLMEHPPRWMEEEKPSAAHPEDR